MLFCWDSDYLQGGDNKHSQQSSVTGVSVLKQSCFHQITKILITSGDSLYGVPSLVESHNE